MSSSVSVPSSASFSGLLASLHRSIDRRLERQAKRNRLTHANPAAPSSAPVPHPIDGNASSRSLAALRAAQLRTQQTAEITNPNTDNTTKTQSQSADGSIPPVSSSSAAVSIPASVSSVPVSSVLSSSIDISSLSGLRFRELLARGLSLLDINRLQSEGLEVASDSEESDSDSDSDISSKDDLVAESGAKADQNGKQEQEKKDKEKEDEARSEVATEVQDPPSHRHSDRALKSDRDRVLVERLKAQAEIRAATGLSNSSRSNSEALNRSGSAQLANAQANAAPVTKESLLAQLKLTAPSSAMGRSASGTSDRFGQKKKFQEVAMQVRYNYQESSVKQPIAAPAAAVSAAAEGAPIASIKPAMKQVKAISEKGARPELALQRNRSMISRNRQFGTSELAPQIKIKEKPTKAVTPIRARAAAPLHPDTGTPPIEAPAQATAAALAISPNQASKVTVVPSSVAKDSFIPVRLYSGRANSHTEPRTPSSGNPNRKLVFGSGSDDSRELHSPVRPEQVMDESLFPIIESTPMIRRNRSRMIAAIAQSALAQPAAAPPSRVDRKRKAVFMSPESESSPLTRKSPRLMNKSQSTESNTKSNPRARTRAKAN